MKIKSIKSIEAQLRTPFKQYEDDAEKGAVKRLETNEVTTGIAFVKQGIDCHKAGITTSESAKYVRKYATGQKKASGKVNPVDAIVAKLSKCNKSQLRFIIKQAQALLDA